MKNRLRALTLVLATLLALTTSAYAQAPSLVQLTTPFIAGTSGMVPTIVSIPITATATAGSTSTLTIPTPPGGLSNYVCSLAYQVNNNNTGTVLSNVVSTSTNFNSFAVKLSLIATNSADSGMNVLFNLQPGAGCPKSTIPGTATTFLSSVSPSNAAWTWYATYYQAP